MTNITNRVLRARATRFGALILAVALLGACGGDDGDDASPTTAAGSATTAAPTAGNTEIVTLDFEFDGLMVVADQTITVVNNGDAPHTLTSEDGAFEEVVVQPGETMTLDGLAAGTYEIKCRFHEGRGMTGTLTVA